MEGFLLLYTLGMSAVFVPVIGFAGMAVALLIAAGIINGFLVFAQLMCSIKCLVRHVVTRRQAIRSRQWQLSRNLHAGGIEDEHRRA